MADMKWTLNPAALEAEITGNPRVVEYCMEIAEQAHAAAIAVFESASHHDPRSTGDYIASLSVEATPSGARMVARDDKWHWVEYGAHAGGKTKVLAYHPLGVAFDTIAGGS